MFASAVLLEIEDIIYHIALGETARVEHMKAVGLLKTITTAEQKTMAWSKTTFIVLTFLAIPINVALAELVPFHGRRVFGLGGIANGVVLTGAVVEALSFSERPYLERVKTLATQIVSWVAGNSIAWRIAAAIGLE